MDVKTKGVQVRIWWAVGLNVWKFERCSVDHDNNYFIHNIPVLGGVETFSTFEDLPVWIPIPPLAEVQIALEQAVAEVTGLKEYTLKKIMRTGTVATIDNRNWELRDQAGPIKRLSQSRAIGLDMESATIAANGFRFRVPYGTLLCVSDKPLHGELKLPGMATEFYTRQVSQHLKIGIAALEKVREMPSERLHSRKLRAFNETAFQ